MESKPRASGRARGGARVAARDRPPQPRRSKRPSGAPEEVVRRADELEQALPGVELAADAARIAAEAAQEACLDARRALPSARKSEQASRAVAAATGRASDDRRPHGSAAPVSVTTGASGSRELSPTEALPHSLVLRGDRRALLVARHAPGRGDRVSKPADFSCCCSSCARQIAARALEAEALRFPEHHPVLEPVRAGRGTTGRGQPGVDGLSLRWPRRLDR